MIDPAPTVELASAIALSKQQIIKISIMSIFGAITHAMIAYRKGETRNLLDVVILTIISAFGGVIGGLLSVYWSPTDEIVLMIGSGMGGYLGVEGLTIFVAYIKNKFYPNQ